MEAASCHKFKHGEFWLPSIVASPLIVSAPVGSQSHDYLHEREAYA
jgi:hypothetical protein